MALSINRRKLDKRTGMAAEDTGKK